MIDCKAIRPRVGVSACLLGESVRYDGGHKRDHFVSDQLSAFFDFQPLCPEAATGMGIPRPPVQLVGDLERPRVLGVADQSLDVTDRLERFSDEKVDTLQDLCGYILKKGSPSCGMARVRVYAQNGQRVLGKGQGVYARTLMQRWPLLPVEDEERLNDPALRENFVNRVYVYHAWRLLLAAGISAASLIDFHCCHKYLGMAHSQAAYKRMGRLLSDFTSMPLHAIADAYIEALMTALKRPVSPGRHVNVLQHIIGYLRNDTDIHDKAALQDAVAAYRRREVALVVPIGLLKAYFRRYPDPCISRQVYLQPHPEQLGLRNAL